MTTSRIVAHRGDLFSNTRGLLVHGCNAQGVMGSGVARIVRDRFPIAYRAYRREYERHGLSVGRIIPCRVSSDGQLWIVNAITQQFYGGDGATYLSYPGLQQCFEHIAELSRSQGNLPVHFPLIGCGLAGGVWSKVAPLIETALGGLEAHLWIPVGQNVPASVVLV